MPNDESKVFEPVFIAANVREVKDLEELLIEEGIEYYVRPQEFVRGNVLWSQSFGGLLFEVLAGQASYCRKLLTAKGYAAGVIRAVEE